MRQLIAIALLGAAPLLFAQHMSSGGHVGGGHFGGGHGSVGPSFPPGFSGLPVGTGSEGRFGRGFTRGNRFGRTPVFLGGGWWDDGGVVVQQPSTPVVIETAPPAPAPVVEERRSAPPLIIERQGDRFVRINGEELNAPEAAPTTTARLQHPTAKNRKSVSTTEQQPESAELAPAVLVYRDGKRQEVTNYTIIGPALYESASYWTSGYWTKKILLADLDLPATVKENQDRGVNFILPSAPNQIITRP